MRQRLASAVEAILARVRSAHPLAVAGVALAILLLRRPDNLSDPQFVYEDGRWYVDALAGGPASLLWPYAGYLHVFQRLAALLEAAAPTVLAPLIGALVTLAVITTVAVAGYRIWWPLAVVVVLLPNTFVEIGSPTFLQFYLAMGLLLGLIAQRLGRAGLVGLAACSIAGPFGLLFTPLFAGRAWLMRDRDSRLRLLAVAIPAAAQAVVLQFAARETVATSFSPLDLLVIASGHLVSDVVGTRFTLVATSMAPTWLVPLAGLAILALLVVAARVVPRSLAVTVGFVLLAATGAAIVAGSSDREHLLLPISSPRYFHVAAAALAGFALFAASRRSKAGLLLVALVLFGWVGDFRLGTLPASSWASDAVCLDTPGPCTVPVWPGGKWDIRWPTDSGGSLPVG